ncbi:hypothetical protein ASG49_16045 [Marmoricola sp. Leaf446]|uniref:hypothetical protein n=1 Tax=Marmoricola sp. Leaf446 TaxID=1736379 RepID=UPI0006F8903E|nr:hypothetical protein [Marmoricola sp. Leaf446]KQT89293.1 hypothetical protein ASG49_16045 [Marmoricola sp. Leaf446]
MCASSARRAAGAALLVPALLLATACTSGSPESSPPPSPTPISDLETASVELPRIAFCSLVPEPDVAAALGGPAQDGASWGNGDTLDLAAPGASGSEATQVVQELGCAWTRGEVTARAWVFARPVTPALARGVVRQAGRERGCETPQGPDFGSPSLLQDCETGSGRRVRHAGLFGQTWLTCELTGPEVEDERAEQWCVTLVNSLDTAS